MVFFLIFDVMFLGFWLQFLNSGALPIQELSPRKGMPPAGALSTALVHGTGQGGARQRDEEVRSHRHRFTFV